MKTWLSIHVPLSDKLTAVYHLQSGIDIFGIDIDRHRSPDMALYTSTDSTVTTKNLADFTIPEFTFHGPAKDKNKEPWLPRNISVYDIINPPRIWVNTGQHFYSKFDTLFDADGGYWSLREAVE